MPFRMCRPRAVSISDQRLDYAKKAFSEKIPLESALGSISDRISDDIWIVLKPAQQTDPDAVVEGFAYANYSKPPIQTKLRKRRHSFCRHLMYPWTEEKFKPLCPNGMAGPIPVPRWYCGRILCWTAIVCRSFFAKKYGSFFSHCLQKGLIGTEFDSNTGQYAVQAPICM